MCWNAQTSFITLIIGTIFNIILWFYTNNSYIKLIALAWQFALFMQLFEGLSWISKNTKNEKLSKISTVSAFFANILQPVVLCIGILYLSKNYKVKLLCLSALLAYVGYIIYNKDELKFDKPLYFNTDKCRHLDLYWWDEISSGMYLYNLLFIICILCLIPKSIAFTQLFYYCISFVISYSLYYCSSASVWCWLGAFAPIYTLLTLQFIKI